MKKCLECENTFLTDKNHLFQKFCSKKCRELNIMKKYICIDCGKNLNSHAKYAKTKRCKSCAGKLVIKGLFKKGCIAWNKGLKGFNEGHPGYNIKIGNKNPAWKGGITKLNLKIRNSDKYFIWRKKIFERDNYTCQKCGKYGQKINADHKIPFSTILEKFLNKYNYETNQYFLFKLALEFDLFWNIDNGRTLCKNCHKETETFAGRATNFLTQKRRTQNE